jgi:ABC-type nitrate/sulfonate/bicarbonate transport system substrate-binding protein
MPVGPPRQMLKHNSSTRNAMRYRLAGLIAATAASLSLAAADVAAEQITVTHWGAAFYGAPYAVAMEKGWFK